MKLDAAQRLTAQSLAVNPIPQSLGNERCKRYTEGLAQQAYKSNLRLGTKNGLTLGWFSVQSTHTFLLSDDSDSVVAYLSLSRNSYSIPRVKGSVRGIFVKKAYRGRKLSTVLYLGALHVFKHLASDSNIASAAVMTWRSLEKFGYDVKLWCVTHDRQVDFEWGANGLPVVWGKPMDKLREEFVFYV